MNQCNNDSPEDSTDPENVLKSKDCDIDELQMKITNKDKTGLISHQCMFLKWKFWWLGYLLRLTKTRITKNVSLTNDLTMNNSSFNFTPTESSAGGNLLYTTNRLSYKPRLNLNIYKSNELEFNFVEILNSKKLILLSIVSINILQWILMILKLII